MSKAIVGNVNSGLDPSPCPLRAWLALVTLALESCLKMKRHPLQSFLTKSAERLHESSCSSLAFLLLLLRTQPKWWSRKFKSFQHCHCSPVRRAGTGTHWLEHGWQRWPGNREPQRSSERHGEDRGSSRRVRITCRSLVQSQSRKIACCLLSSARRGLWRSSNKVSLEFLEKIKILE